MSKYFIFSIVLYLCSFTNGIYNNDVHKKNAFFRKDYKFYDSTQSFYKLHTIGKKWIDAKKRCLMEDATLWHPEDQAEVVMIMEYWKKKLPTQLKLHVGLSDLLSEGLWETVDGKPVEDVWHNWGETEPNNSGGVENCAVLRRDSTGADLNDEHCDYVHPFICKKALASVEWNIFCDIADKSYLYNQELGKCYKFYKNIVTWTEAYSVCAAEGSYLAIINSEKEKDYLVQITADAETDKIPWDHWDIRQVHIGFHRRFKDGWQTVKGEALEESGYFVWGPGQPDNLNEEECGSMFREGVYNDYKCDKFAFFICERDLKAIKSPNCNIRPVFEVLLLLYGWPEYFKKNI